MRLTFFLFFVCIIINSNAQLSATILQKDECTACNGCDGGIVILASGGTPPYTISNSNMYFLDNILNDSIFIYEGICGAQGSSVPPDTFFIEDSNNNLVYVTTTFVVPDLIYAFGTGSPDTCQRGVGYFSVDSIVGGRGPFEYSFDDGQTWISDSSSYLPIGYHYVYVRDSDSCLALVNQSQTEIINVWGDINTIGQISVNPSYCNNGSIMLELDTSLAPFSVNWSWPLNNNNTPIQTNLQPGTYTGVLTDSEGCLYWVEAEVDDSSSISGCSTISGKIIMDDNQNCFDDGEIGVPNRMVIANPGNFVAISDSNGNYTLSLPYGSYQIEQTIPASFNVFCNNGYSVSTNQMNEFSFGNDFYDSLNIDLYSEYGFGLVRTMISSQYSISFINHSPDSVASILYHVLDNQFDLDLTNPPYDYVSNDTLFWIGDIPGFGVYNVNIMGTTPLLVGEKLAIHHGIYSSVTEVNFINNHSLDSVEVIASFDPNDKQVWPSGNIDLSDELLTYRIRFQNTGTDTAFNIFIMDTLSSHLDPATFEFLTASHNCIPEIINNNILKFTFPNIMLVDSTRNEPLSHGFVNFRIKQNPNNEYGDVINNTAGIYFDYNEPVITNTVSSSIVQDLNSIQEFKLSDLSVYPNPAKNAFTIDLGGSKTGEIQIVDAMGRIVYKNEFNGKSKLEINSSNWEKGIYMIRMITNDEVSSSMIVIE